MALDRENNSRTEIVSISKSRFFNDIIKEAYLTNSVSINEISNLNSLIFTVEYFDNSGNILKQLGDSRFYINKADTSSKNFFYPKFKIIDKELIYYQFSSIYNNSEIFIVLGYLLPDNFSSNGVLLTSVKKSLEFTTPIGEDISFGIFIYYLLFSIPMVLLAILGSFIFSDEIVKPLADIEEAIKKVAHGNYSYRILSKKKNEFNSLIRAFNNMIKEIEKSRNKLKHTEQISTWQDIATRLAHEIRNPLTPIKLSAQRVLLKSDNNVITTKHMETIITEVTRMEKLLNEFRDFARFPKLNIERVSIKETIEESLAPYNTIYPNILFDTSAVEDFQVDIDKNQLIQVISNLTINGIHAMEKEGVVKYISEVVQMKSVDYCRVTIKDNGKGISSENLPNIFKPYFTTKYNGSGIGLAIVNKIILDHKGKIWIESALNVGTTFYFEFPKDAI
ncbi:HAMP domain-containing histidine kinase [Thiospirochaeta perfilievii]|uniref:histidine kinase n=1 Tax=Thiospirochaeta perfilievii TaxID=252967 RepID=A0A5C1QBB3_9SPIO|nr:HAMP domain-containing histidine kinase [Thiospirochaeta perfilievii]